MSLASCATSFTSSSLIAARPTSSGAMPATRKYRALFRRNTVANASKIADTEHGAHLMRLHVGRIRERTIGCPRGGERVGVERVDVLDVDGRTERKNAATMRRRVAEFAREARQQRRLTHRTARVTQPLLDDVGKAEMLQQRDDVRESLVESEDVRIHRRRKLGSQRVEQRVRRLVRDDVVRQRREHQPARNRMARRIRLGVEPAERQARPLRGRSTHSARTSRTVGREAACTCHPRPDRPPTRCHARALCETPRTSACRRHTSSAGGIARSRASAKAHSTTRAEPGPDRVAVLSVPSVPCRTKPRRDARSVPLGATRTAHRRSPRRRVGRTPMGRVRRCEAAAPTARPARAGTARSAPAAPHDR